MCIVCNCGNEGVLFLMHFEKASKEIKAAKDAMLKCAAKFPDANYDAMHKKMTRLLREWNAIEHERELCKSHIPDVSKDETE